jgi:hypothetical protein
MRGEVRTSFAFCPFYLQVPTTHGSEVQTPMEDQSANSSPAPQRGRNTAEYLYQGATILAALLLVLSAAV